MESKNRYLRVETTAIFMAILAVLIAGYGMEIYVNNATAIWLITARRVTISSAILAACAAIVFVFGYTQAGFGSEKRTLVKFLRRTGETVALTLVYAVSVGLISAAGQVFISQIFGHQFAQYQVPIVIAFAAVVGYGVYVQAALMNSRVIATLLPVFVISGVTVAGMFSDDPVWWKNNFSQLGDRTTFAATVFNYTLILGGITMLIISYFAISEIITQHRLFERHLATDPETKEFRVRIAVFALLLTMASLMFSAIGIFRYTPHPFLHNFFARGIALPMTLLMIGMPWFVKRFSPAFYVISDVILAIIAGSYLYWYQGNTSLTNVEALAVIMFMGWFILFARQIAALEADRFLALENLPQEIVQQVGHSRLDPRR